MPVTHHIDATRGLMVVVWEGNVTTDELRAIPERVVSDPAWRPGMPVLSDTRRLGRAFTATELYDNAADIRRLGERIGFSRCAVVVSEPVMYGTGRMFEVFAERGPVEVRVFYDVAEAEAWLLSSPAKGREPRDPG